MKRCPFCDKEIQDRAVKCKQPVLHRDLKPSNIMISKDGEVRLTDFGIARKMKDSYTCVIGKQDTSGTLPYMSPEQVRGKRPTAAMDIYSLGVVCYECLSGQLPFHTGEITYQILHEPPEPLKDPAADVDDALRQALAKEPGERPATGSELVRLLRGQDADDHRHEAPHESDLPWSGTKRLILPADLIEVSDADYAPLDGLAPGGQKAQECQRQAVAQLGLPLEVKTAKTKIAFRLVPPGDFAMGAACNDQGPDEFAPQHRVTLTRPFYCAMYPITQVQWESVMGDNPSDFKNAGQDAPVTRVSWQDCQVFLEKLCKMEDASEGTYRLLTEAEWEYACRAGTVCAFSFGDSEADLDAYGWYGDNSDDKTHPVGQKKPNGWGLYDMHGNVAEWCQDRSGLYPDWPLTDPHGPSSPGNRICRGGGWCSQGVDCQSSERSWSRPDFRGISVGFRLARTILSHP